MMPLNQRSYAGEAEWQAIAQLNQADPNFHHPVDFPWRLCSTSLEDDRNAAVWEDERGHMQIFAALQFPWLTLDYAIHPESRSWAVESQVIDWGEGRLRQIAEETSSHFPFNLCAFAHEQERITFLEGRGYVRWENFLVVFNRSLTSLPKPDIPQGFAIRTLDGEREAEACAALQRAAFESTTMTAAWRRRTVHAPLYNPALDLVVTAPDGRLAGFCIWWFQPALKMAQIEPIGVHPDFQKLGLSQALMFEGFGRAAAQGAETAQVETYNFSQPAILAYEAAGFEVITHKLKYYKQY